ncbi:28S ribosomal S34 protein [Perilla frutescens var. hirtella]|uniref:28S ribosomal S34 protein n=1 Tax=Perilla frutescens var. hirtella TaxID=608512 RepID=A0AAD4JNP0_PERFH|nr:28S ribosomal S34 protein [Perilla frutescens var. hirtella]KAH6837157.1 28S ribosomal S34 protein [Perilla frutescens var. hirtella]
MATVLIAKRATTTLGKTSDLFRASFSFLRGLSTSSSAENAAAGDGVKKPRRKKKKNLFEVAQFLPNWGIGYHMAKTHWAEVSYEITKINLYKDGRHGKAWGLAYKNGVPAADAPKKISGVHKRCWRYIPNAKGIEESAPKQEGAVPKQELETA